MLEPVRQALTNERLSVFRNRLRDVHTIPLFLIGITPADDALPKMFVCAPKSLDLMSLADMLEGLAVNIREGRSEDTFHGD